MNVYQAMRMRISRPMTTQNPKGIPAQSPGLRGTSYPGATDLGNNNPERVAASKRGSKGYGRKPVGVHVFSVADEEASALQERRYSTCVFRFSPVRIGGATENQHQH